MARRPGVILAGLASVPTAWDGNPRLWPVGVAVGLAEKSVLRPRTFQSHFRYGYILNLKKF